MKQFYKIIFVVLALLTGMSMYGQTSLGAFTGFNFGTLSGDAPDRGTYVSYPGFNAGITLDVPLGSVVKLSLQPSFSQEGTRVFYDKKGELDPFDSVRLRLNYLSVPLMVKVQSSSRHFYAIGGIETGFLMNYRLTSNGEALPNMLFINSVNVAAHFGAGYRIFLGHMDIFLEVRYSQGLLNITDEPVDESYVPRVKTTGFRALVGIELPLSKSKK